MKILIAGSREFRSKELVELYFDQIFKLDEDILINGRCPDGVDLWVYEYALQKGLPKERISEHPAEWTKYDRAAGPIRNEKMVKEAEKVVVFWDGKSKGSKTAIDYALKYKKDLEVIF